MSQTHIQGVQIATKNTQHTAPGPPATSLVPPTPPAGPVPAPFLYVARAKTAMVSTCAPPACLVNGARILIKGSKMDVEPPSNAPAQPVGPLGGDLLSKAIKKEGYVMDGLKDGALVKGESIAVTGSIVYLNLIFKGQKVYQVMSAFLSRAGMRLAKRDSAFARRVAGAVITDGDPVDVAAGSIVDERVDLEFWGGLHLEWLRSYDSADAAHSGALGRGGWRHAFEQAIRSEPVPALESGYGAAIALPALVPGERAFVRAFGLDVERDRDGLRYRVHGRDDGLTRLFEPLVAGGPAVLREIRDGAGNAVTLAYRGRELERVRDEVSGRAFVVAHDAGRVAQVDIVVDGKVERSVRYAYHPSGELASAAGALGATDRYSYDAEHRMTEKVLPHGRTIRYAFDETSGRCVKTWGTDGRHTVEFAYDQAARKTFTSGTPRPRSYEYNEHGFVVASMAPGGADKTSYEYDADGLVLCEKNANGAETRHEYDARGHRIQTTHPDGRTETFAYQRDALVEHVDRLGRITRYAYDGHGRMVRVRAVDGTEWSLEYDERGRLARLFDDDGPCQRCFYDERGDRVRIEDRRGATQVERDALGQVVRLEDALGRDFRYAYDEAGRLARKTLPGGGERRYAYDRAGNLVAYTDELGMTTRYEVAGVRSVGAVTAPDGRVLRYEDDMVESIRFVHNARGECYEQRYDRAGRVVEETAFDGGVTRYRYDPAGGLARIDHEDETWREFVHDESGNVVVERSPHGAITYGYDAIGQPLEATVDDPLGPVVLRFERDALGRLVAETQGKRTIHYEYDALGRRAARRLPDGSTTRYEYDKDGRLAAVVHDATRIELVRDAAGREIERRVPRAGLVLQHGYALRGGLARRLCLRDEAARGGSQELYRLELAFDVRGQPIAKSDARWGEVRYRYDEVGRLLEATAGAAVEHCRYDAAGYLVQRGRATDGGFSLLAGNLLARADEREFEYDACRRRALERDARGETRYFWDCRQRLREIWFADGRRARYAYDAFGRRVRKELFAAPSAAAPEPEPAVTEFLWDSDELAAEVRPDGTLRVFVHLPHGEGIGAEPLLEARAGALLLYVNDHLGTPQALVDIERGRVAWSARTSAWGEVVEASSDGAGGALGTPFRLLGHYHDDESGLSATRFRYFDARVARWLSPDPFGLEAGVDLHGWSGAPTCAVDPLGLQPASSYGPGDVGRYGSVGGHELLQNVWLETQGVGTRGCGTFSRGNPALPLSQDVHNDAHHGPGGYDPRSTSPEVRDRNPTTMMNKAAKALRQAGVPNETIKEMKKQAKKHAPKWIC